MAFLMSDVAAGSNAALQLQRNMAAAPDVQQTQANVMQEQANTLQQQQQNVEKTKLANIVADTGIKTDADIRSKIQNLVKDDSYTKASPSEQTLKLASLYAEAGKAEETAKLMETSERIATRDLVNQSKKADIERQSIADASSVLETIPDAQVNDRFNSLPEATRNLVIGRVGEANWNNFSPKEKKAVVQNLFETANSKLQEQKIQANIQMAQIRAAADVQKTALRLANSERLKVLGDDKLVRIWGTVNTQIEKVQRDPATVTELKRLNEEVDKALTAATKSTTFGSLSFLGMGDYKPEGSDTPFYSKDSFNKWQQATTKRDKFIQGQLLEERALVESLPTEAGSIKSNMLKKIDTQLSTLQLEEPGAKKKPEVTPTVPTDAKTHDGFPARKNADGSYSTEVSITVTNPKLNDGKPTNIPSLWKGKEVDENTAVENALATGKKYESFSTIPEAVAAAKERSNAGGAGATSNKSTSEIKPLELKDVKVGRAYWPSQPLITKANDAIANGADVEAVMKRLRDAGYDITAKDLNPEWVKLQNQKK